MTSCIHNACIPVRKPYFINEPLVCAATDKLSRYLDFMIDVLCIMLNFKAAFSKAVLLNGHMLA